MIHWPILDNARHIYMCIFLHHLLNDNILPPLKIQMTEKKSIVSNVMLIKIASTFKASNKISWILDIEIFQTFCEERGSN